MLHFVLGILLVPVVDQLLKRCVRHRRSEPASAGLRVVDAQVWLVRANVARHPFTLWMIWLPCAAILGALTWMLPACGAGAGLLLGGSASHALETTRRGRICDYIHLGFWPAFNVADAAITLGALALAFNGWQHFGSG